jgi:hypothetical protein
MMDARKTFPGFSPVVRRWRRLNKRAHFAWRRVRKWATRVQSTQRVPTVQLAAVFATPWRVRAATFGATFLAGGMLILLLNHLAR